MVEGILDEVGIRSIDQLVNGGIDGDGSWYRPTGKVDWKSLSIGCVHRQCSWLFLAADRRAKLSTTRCLDGWTPNVADSRIEKAERVLSRTRLR